MRIFYSSMIQETNTFCPQKTDISLFERGYLLYGQEIGQKLSGTNTEIGGFCTYFSHKADELVPGVASWAIASGKVEDKTYEKIASSILESLKKSLPVDGVLLALHGAMVAESTDDCEGDLLFRVRSLVGPKIPIVVSLDYHANVTAAMVQNCDAATGYRTYPHVDFKETGIKAAAILDRLIHGSFKPIPLFQKLPLIVPVEDSETAAGISGEILRRIKKLDRQKDLLGASLFCSQPWLDVKEAGVSLLFYLTDEKNLPEWEERVRELADKIMEKKEAFFKEYPSIEQVAASLNRYKKPMILVDSGDITSAGGLGDSTVVLRALLKTPGCRAALSIVSPKAVEAAFQIGAGRSGELVIGGTTDYGYNGDVRVRAKVLLLTDRPSSVRGESFSGIQVDAGRRASLLIGGGLFVVVAEYASLMFDPQFLRDMEIEPSEMDIIVQKSHKLFRAAYKDTAKQIVLLDTPGFTDKNLKRLPFEKVPRPIFPLDHLCDHRYCN